MRRRNGTTLLEMCLAIALASTFYVAYSGVLRQLRQMDVRAAEKHALTAAACALGRAIVDRPELVTRPRELEAELKRLTGASGGERIDVDRRPSEQLEADIVTITVRRGHPVTGLSEAKAMVMLDAQR